jgi:hypothetical protein
MAPPELAQPTLPNLGWRPPDLDTKSYTLADFDTGQAELKKAHRDTIDEVVKALARDPLLGGYVTVVGYADAIGPNPENKVLGQQRADAVRSELVDKGVSADDVRAYSLGEEVLAVDTPKAEPKNRRVEIVVRRRRMRFGLTQPSRGTTIGPGKGGPESQGGTWQPGPQGGGRPGVGPEFERRIRELAEGKGAAKGTAFDEAVDFLARNASKDLADDVADIAQALGFDRKKAKEMVEQGIKKGIEAGLKEALSKLLEALAGPQSARPPLETGPPVFELPKPTTVPIPLPFPGDEPKAANVNNATLRIDEKISGNLTKIRYKPGEFVTFTFTTPESFGQLRTVAEIVPAGGGAALRSLDVRGRRSGQESLAVPDSPGSYVLQVRIFGEDAHPRASFRFSVE